MSAPHAGPASPRAPWVLVLAATFGMQVAIMIAAQAIPVIGPLLTEEAGLAPETIGYLTGTAHLGTVLYLLVGGPVILRFGAVRTLQIGAAAAVCALLLATSGLAALLFLGAFVLGLGNGPTVPAGSRILARTVPPEHRSLIFSVKQAGAPLGGILSAMALPPVAILFGWRPALLLAALIVLGAIAAVQPLRAGLDTDLDGSRRIGLRALLSPRNLAGPFTALRSAPVLLPFCGMAIAFSVVQGCFFAFTVTLLTTAHGYSLAEAGTVFACMQAGGFAGRIGLSWLADRTGAAIAILLMMLGAAGVAAAVFAVAANVAPMPVVALAAAAVGMTGTAFQGIMLAEMARLAPPDRLAEATAGAALLGFLTYFAAPAAFAYVVRLSGDWTLPMLIVAAQAVVTAVLLAPRLLREARAAA
ncbi:MFS transporter [Roseomonas sp. HF4]|uniref:MFS transporter n=1 Tax=Roseomonas sp. HF4 TaxID=2562313 RepID=UPI0010C03188|nr:MFS transporter [Roseomonas sp. HF4]